MSNTKNNFANFKGATFNNKMFAALLSLTLFLFASQNAQAAEMGIPVQLRLKAPGGTYPTESGLTFRLMVLSPSGGCVIRDEEFSSQSISDGNISLNLGSGSAGAYDPSLTLLQAYDNTTAKTGLTCVDANNNIVSSGQTYNPAAGDKRILRVSVTVSGDAIIANLNMKAVPYALHADAVGGKAAADLITRNNSTQLNQANLEDLLADATKFNNLKNIADSGFALTAGSANSALVASSATTANSATNFSGSLTGDVTGTQAATVVAAIRGVGVAATAPTSGQVLAFNGSQYVPSTPSNAPVNSVNGQTGTVVLTVADISGALTSGSSLSGDVTGTISSNTVSQVGGKTAAAVAASVDDTVTATSSASANTLVRRDGSGNITVNSVMSANNSTQNVYIYNVAGTNYARLNVPASFSNYTLTLPTGVGSNGQVLQTDGSGNLSWANQSTAGVNSVSATSPLASTGGSTPTISITQSTSSTNGYLSSSDWVTFNNKMNATSGAVVSALGYTPADNSALSSYLTQAAFNAYVASASCTSSQAMYWNSVSSQFMCQAISVSSGVVTAALGYTPANSSTVVHSAQVPSCGAGQYLTYNGSAWSCATDSVGSGVNSVSATSPIASTGGLTPTISIAQATNLVDGYLSSTDWNTFNNKMNATSAAVVSALGYTPADNSSLSNYVLKSNNLSDLASSATARTNLGLGGAAILNVGTSAGTVAAGNDSRITGAVQSAAIPTCSGGQYLTYNGSAWSCATDAGATGVVNTVSATSPLASTGGATPTISITQSTSSTNGYLSSSDWVTFNNKLAATSAAVVSALGYTPANNTSLANYALKSNNLSDLASSATARTNLGLGGAAVLNVGTTAGTVAAGNDSRITSALNASTVFAGDVSGTSSAMLVTKVQGVGLSFSSLANNHILQHNGTNFVNRLIPTCSAGQYLTFNGTSWSCASEAQATSSSDGYLASTDWVIFNNKMDATSSAVVSALGYTPANNTSLANYALKSNNLSDLASSATARTNLGLGGAAILNVGTSAGTVAAGNDSRITGAVQSTAFDGYVASASCTSAQTMYWNSVSSQFLCQDIQVSGDVSGTAAAATVTKIQGVPVNAAVPVAGQALVYDGTEWVPTTGFPKSSRATVNQTINGTTYTNVTNLSFSVVSGKTYKFKFNVLYATSATTRGLRLRLDHGGASVFSALASIPSSTTTGTGFIGAGTINASGGVFAATATPAGVQYAQVEGVIVANADGTVQLVASQSNTGSLTIYAGSVVEFRELQ